MPSGAVARVNANLAALRVLRACQNDARTATPAEQHVLAGWSGWGAVPRVFDTAHPEFAATRETLTGLLSTEEYAAASRNTLNAHYTDPALVSAIWTALGELGFREGRVLEPGCGSGTFIGLAPPGAQMVGVELDPVTAGITALLYPPAQVLPESFADTRAPEGAFDAAVGNVPFAKITLSDPRHNQQKHSIHNHFIIKSLHLVAPGGLVALITSRYTLDAANPAARREIAALADLLGAIRLPSSAHQRTAGTTVVTDLLVLRRREADYEPDGESEWERTELVPAATLAASQDPTGVGPGSGDAGLVEGDQAVEEVRVNRWFIDHPEMVCGQLGVGRGMFSGAELTVHADRPAPELLTEALAALVASARERELTHSPTTGAAPRRAALVGRAANLTEGHLAVDPDHPAGEVRFSTIRDGQVEPFTVPGTQSGELAALLGLRDVAVALLSAEAASMDDTEEIHGLRTELNRRYDRYHQRWGPINRFSWRRTGRTDPDTGEELLARATPRQGGFREDPHSPVVYALEDFDTATATATKAPVMSRRVIAPRVPRLGADTPADALAICLDTHGRVDLDEIARLLGTTPARAREQLGTLVFDDPAPTAAHAAALDAAVEDPTVERPADLPATTAGQSSGVAMDGRFIAAAEYLSGNVRAKLAEAQAAASLEERFTANVTALRAVVPPDIAPEDIRVQLGAPWISQPYVQAFLRETFNDQWLTAEHAYGVQWSITGRERGVEATETWGTPAMPAPKLAQTLLRQQAVIVRDDVPYTRPDGTEGTRSVVNPTKTEAAKAKADELTARFAEWVWADPERARELSRAYNTAFNSLVLRSYDDTALSLPGLVKDFTPMPHQLAAVARMVNEPAAGLWHEVGAGKTAEMAMGVMELRRLGLVTKPAIVIPNHMIEQFTREFAQLFPRARLLAISSADLVAKRRREFVARIATGEWDAVILTRGAFERIPMSPTAQADYIDAQQDALREAIERQRSSGERSLSLKRMEGALLRAEERIKDRLEHDYDPAVTFETTGVDYLCIDEGHAYKNLSTASNIDGAAIDGSSRASDLDMKLHYLRARNPGGRVVTFATATPIANSITEAHVMLRYLRPDLLAAAGIAEFDSWAAAFGQTVSDVELSVTGGVKVKQRFAKFHNVPELLRLWWVPGDVKTAEDLNLPRPELAARADGKREPVTVLIPRSAELAQFMADLETRAERISGGRVEKDADNMLSITREGRAAALDLRLLGRDPGGGESKLDVAADTIARIWAEHRDHYLTPDGEPSAILGGFQIVFCDQGTPPSQRKDRGRWNAYDELKRLLLARGVPGEQVRFVQSARNDREKAELFADCRAGRVAVLVGSTETMGVGTNVQTRAVALHHLDCPWRPADLAQRDGRALRRGNQNPEISIYRYVTENSFDAYSWQTVARKAVFIAQLMRGKLDVREIEDIGDNALSFTEVKALAAGNPLLLDQARAVTELTRLERLERSHVTGRTRLRQLITHHEHTRNQARADVAALDDAIGRRVDTRGEAFTARVDDLRLADRAAAGTQLHALLDGALHTARPGRLELPEVARLGGHVIDAAVWRAPAPGWELTVRGVRSATVSGSRDALREMNPAGLIQRVENQLHRLERYRDQAHQTIDGCGQEIERARGQLDREFPHGAALEAARRECARIAQQLGELAASQPDQTGPGQQAGPDGQAEQQDGPGGADRVQVARMTGLRLAQTPVTGAVPRASPGVGPGGVPGGLPGVGPGPGRSR